MWGDIHIELRVLAHTSDRAKKGIPGTGNSMCEGDGTHQGTGVFKELLEMVQKRGPGGSGSAGEAVQLRHGLLPVPWTLS